MVTLQQLLDSKAADHDLVPGVDCAARRLSSRYCMPGAVKLADRAALVQACGLRLGEANVIYLAAGGRSGRQLAVNCMLDEQFNDCHTN